eukprot:scaffold343_cov120-Isochrysis_galbana.AAC.3
MGAGPRPVVIARRPTLALSNNPVAEGCGPFPFPLFDILRARANAFAPLAPPSPSVARSCGWSSMELLVQASPSARSTSTFS